MTTSGGVEELRRRNTGLVLTSLRHDGPATRTELARRTGLAKATIGAIVGSLERDDLVEDTDPVTDAGPLPVGRGRPGRPVTLTGRTVVGLGVEVNVDYVSVVRMDLSGEVREHETVAVLGHAPLDVIEQLVRHHAAQVQAAGHRLAGVTAAVPGLVAADAATVRWAPNLHWRDLDLAAVLRKAAGDDVVCTIDNDANCAALAESRHGAATGAANALYLTGTVGIGAGILHDGDLLRGAAGFAGEVGHLPFGDSTVTCACGRVGCWETHIGLRAMLAAVNMHEEHTPWESAVAVAQQAGSDQAVRAGLAVVGTRLGRGVAALASIVDPDVVVLGGYFVPIAPWLLPTAEQALEDHLLFADLHLPEIRLSSLDLRAAAIGAAEQSLTGVLSGGR
ncbi:ROK family protein [Aeromicrobium sp. CF3.5]|uniref:ROK family protein n=1 Tax=Aeromicrobium sp. CF3.5 TaxID=3373078 RepID=UPI003EE68684